MPARHLFTSRDLTLRGDDTEWTAVDRSLGVPAGRLLLIKQVHGVHAAVVRQGWQPPWTRPQADIIATDDPSIAIGVRVADCAPVLLLDRRLGVAAAAHGGWRGTAAGASAAAVETLSREFGSRATDLIAAIGPCPACCRNEPRRHRGVPPAAGPGVGAVRQGACGDRWFLNPGAPTASSRAPASIRIRSSRRTLHEDVTIGCIRIGRRVIRPAACSARFEPKRRRRAMSATGPNEAGRRHTRIPHSASR